MNKKMTQFKPSGTDSGVLQIVCIIRLCGSSTFGAQRSASLATPVTSYLFSELHRNSLPWRIWEESQRCRKSSDYLRNIARLTRGRGCSRKDGVKKLVRPADQDPSTRTAGNVGQYVVGCVWPPHRVLKRALGNARMRVIWAIPERMWTGMRNRSNSHRLGKLCFVSRKSTLETLTQAEEISAANHGRSSRQILRTLPQGGRGL